VVATASTPQANTACPAAKMLFAASCGGAPIEVVRKYIEQQDTHN